MVLGERIRQNAQHLSVERAPKRNPPNAADGTPPKAAHGTPPLGWRRDYLSRVSVEAIAAWAAARRATGTRNGEHET